MQQSKRNKLKPGWVLVIKLFIALLAAGFVYYQVVEKQGARKLAGDYDEIFSSRSKQFLLLIVALLMICNWSVEAVKWKRMISRIQKMEFGLALRAVFSGITVSFFTPNRIGEYAGRILYIQKGNPVKATLITVIQSMSQLLVTLIAGSVSLIIYLEQYAGFTGLSLTMIAITALLLISVFSTIYFRIPVFINLSAKFKITQRWAMYTGVLSYFSGRDLAVIVLLSALRFIIFTTQFYLLLNVFNVGVSFMNAVVLISMTFFAMSVIPTIALTEIGVRGAVATFFFSKVTGELYSVINATVSLWIINLVIPALTGIALMLMFQVDNKQEQ